VFKDGDGEFYILFGVWEYYMARLNQDMVSLAEQPRKVIINHPSGPYGKGTTDDKPFLHKYRDTYYLSWGAFYAMADHVYGPYHYAGTVMVPESFTPGYIEPTWPHGPLQGRHGSFFEWNNQWYFAYCDMSQTGNRYFRDSFISYVHYRDNGEIVPVRVDGTGVGRYDADRGRIEAEDYFMASGIEKKETADLGMGLAANESGSFAVYPNICGLEGKSKILLNLSCRQPMSVQVRREGPQGELLADCQICPALPGTKDVRVFELAGLREREDLCMVFRGRGIRECLFNSFSFK
jgi:hypothetical protein